MGNWSSTTFLLHSVGQERGCVQTLKMLVVVAGTTSLKSLAQSSAVSSA